MKRKAVSLISRFYDPLGVLSPITIRFKVLIQELWDEPLEGDVLKVWKELTTDLGKSEPVAIDQYYFSTREGDVQYQLFGFCDTSTIAYAVVIYIVEICPVVKQSSFVVSKTRVAPQTIPRLELLSTLLLARLMKTVMDSLKTQLTPRCFTDSQIGLYWITGIEKDWKPFVQNRVSDWYQQNIGIIVQGRAILQTYRHTDYCQQSYLQVYCGNMAPVGYMMI